MKGRQKRQHTILNVELLLKNSDLGIYISDYPSMDDEQESPTSSPAPGRYQHREYDDEFSMNGEAEAFASGYSETLDLAGPSYRYLDDHSPSVSSQAPSHSGLDADYDLLNGSQDASISLSRQFDVLSGASVSSSAYLLTSSSEAFQSLPGPSRRLPTSSDPVFSAHSQPIQNELLNYLAKCRLHFFFAVIPPTLDLLCVN